MDGHQGICGPPHWENNCKWILEGGGVEPFLSFALCCDGQETPEGLLHAALSQQPVADLAVPPGGNMPTKIIKWDLELRGHCFIGPSAGGHFTAALLSTNGSVRKT